MHAEEDRREENEAVGVRKWERGEEEKGRWGGRARCGKCDMDAAVYSNEESKTTCVIHVIMVSIYEYEQSRY